MQDSPRVFRDGPPVFPGSVNFDVETISCAFVDVVQGGVETMGIVRFRKLHSWQQICLRHCLAVSKIRKKNEKSGQGRA